MKDVETRLPEKLIIPCIPTRENPCDMLLSKQNHTLENLTVGATVGTSSLRRQALLLHLRKDLKVVPLRGTVGTRTQKIKDGLVTATIVAYAGLSRDRKSGVEGNRGDDSVVRGGHGKNETQQ